MLSQFRNLDRMVWRLGGDIPVSIVQNHDFFLHLFLICTVVYFTIIACYVLSQARNQTFKKMVSMQSPWHRHSCLRDQSKNGVSSIETASTLPTKCLGVL